MTTPTYEQDFYAWTHAQAAALRAKEWAALDLENLAEEIESLGRSDRRAIESHLLVLLQHLLKWAYQPQGRGSSWRSSIRHARREIAKLIGESPSLHDYPAQCLTEAYRDACQDAADETSLPVATFPATCPWSLEQLRDDNFLPEDIR